MSALWRVLLILLMAWWLPAGAIDIVDDLTPEQEARYQELAAELRCLVCQNQSLADSNAELAGDMRAVVRRMIKGGADNETILRFMTDRYGDFVRYRPPLNPATILLWVIPFFVLLGGIFAIIITVRRRQDDTTTLTTTDREEAGKLLEE